MTDEQSPEDNAPDSESVAREQNREELKEQLVSAYRPFDLRGPCASPAWFDLDPHERLEAYERTVRARAIETTLDREQLSPTARAVLAAIRKQVR